MKRVIVIVAGLLLLAAIPAGKYAYDRLLEWPPFDAERFRAAAARGDLETMESEAHAAEAHGTLLGLPRARVIELLGPPDRIATGTHVWELGMINDALGPGDAGAFYVRFGPDGRVARVAVSQSEP